MGCAKKPPGWLQLSWAHVTAELFPQALWDSKAQQIKGSRSHSRPLSQPEKQLRFVQTSWGEGRGYSPRSTILFQCSNAAPLGEEVHEQESKVLRERRKMCQKHGAMAALKAAPVCSSTPGPTLEVLVSLKEVPVEKVTL